MKNEKEYSEIVEKELKKKNVMEATFLVLLVLGVFVVLLGLFFNPIPTTDIDHLTDPSIAVRDLDNATYTWTADEITTSAKNKAYVVFLGVGLIMAAYPLIFLTTGDREFHKRYCEPVDPSSSKYCPECGLKLSRLEKK